MEWNERLRELVEASPKQKKELALEWHGAAKKKSVKVPGTGTVITNLSKCLAADKDGVSCFFKERRRAEALFDVLGVEDQETRDELFEGADQFLALGGVRAPKLVIDATGWESDAAETIDLFTSLRKEFVDPAVLRPVVVLVTEDQLDAVPRSFDKRDHVDVIEVALDSARDRVEQLAGDGALVASPWTYEDPARWMALHFVEGALSYEPSDGLATFASEGELPLPEAPAHGLDEWGDTADGANERLVDRLLADPTRRWALRFELADEQLMEQRGWSPATRVALAEALGVKATSTAGERTRVELDRVQRALGLDPEEATASGLEERLQRAKRRPLRDVLLRVGDALHLLNPTGEPPASPLLEVHRVECPVPALERLRAEVADWTLDDAEDDPFLEAAIERLDPDGDERGAFLHAAACILHSKGLTPKPVMLSGEWQRALSELLEGEPPVAELRAQVKERAVQYEPRFVLPSARVEGAKQKARERNRVYLFPAPVTPSLTFGRGEPVSLAAWSSYYGDSSWHRVYSNDSRYRAPLVMGSLEALEDSSLWLDLYEASGAASSRDWDAAVSEHARHLASVESPYWTTVELPVADSIWRSADRYVSMLWLSLRRALQRAEAVAVTADSTVLLHLGGGLFAELAVRAHRAQERRAALLLTVAEAGREGFAARGVEHFVVTHEAATTGYANTTTRMGHTLPRQVRLTGAGWRVDVTFVASALVGGFADAAPMQLAVSGASAAQAQAEADRREEEESYYYDD